jgi:hypothetical protein
MFSGNPVRRIFAVYAVFFSCCALLSSCSSSVTASPQNGGAGEKKENMENLVKIKVGLAEYLVPADAATPVKSYIEKMFPGGVPSWSILVDAWDDKSRGTPEFIRYFPSIRRFVQITADNMNCVDDCPIDYHFVVVGEKDWKSFNSPDTFNAFIASVPASINKDNALRYAKMVFSLLYTDKSRYRSGWSVDGTTTASLTEGGDGFTARIPIMLTAFGPFHPGEEVFHGVANLTVDGAGKILAFRQE